MRAATLAAKEKKINVKKYYGVLIQTASANIKVVNLNNDIHLNFFFIYFIFLLN